MKKQIVAPKTKGIKFYFRILILLIFSACTDDCGECFSPPSPFVFEIVDAVTGENLFTNGTYQSNEIRVQSIDDAGDAGFAFLSENQVNLLQINGIGWKTENVRFRVIVATDTLFTLGVNALRLNEDCCSFTQYTKVEIGGTPYHYNPTSGIYQIMVEP